MMARYQVFISSTFDDLKEERSCLWQRLTDHNYIVAGMENFPSTSDEPFEYIKPLIEESDYFLLVIGDRYGSDFGNTGKSYTETEFDYAVECGIPVLVFPIDELSAASSRTVDRDLSRYENLKRFRTSASNGRMTRNWKNAEDLSSVVVQALSFEGQRKPRPGWVRGSNASELDLTREIIRLQSENDILKNKLQSYPDLTDEEMTSVLDRTIVTDAIHIPDGGRESISFQIRQLIALEPTFSEVSNSSIKRSIQILFSTLYNSGQYLEDDDNKCVDLFGVNDLDVDTLLLYLRRNGIIEFEKTDAITDIKRGKNWILAQELSKVGAWVK